MELKLKMKMLIKCIKFFYLVQPSTTSPNTFTLNQDKTGLKLTLTYNH